MQRRRKRALIGAAAAASAAAIAVVLTLALRRDVAPERIVVPPAAPAESLDIADLRTSEGVPLRIEPPPLPPMTEEPIQLRVAPASPSPPQSAAPHAAAPEPRRPPPDPQAPLEVSPGTGGADGGGGGAEGRVDPFLRPRAISHPDIPTAIVRKRRIDDTVIVQVQVGVDGRILDVRVLDGIANCPECDQSAIAAARRYVYDAPVGGPVWAAPIRMGFHHNRGG